MLGNGKCSKRPVECSSSQSDNRLAQEELQIHLPYLGHLVEKDYGAFEKGIDFLVLRRKNGRV